MYGRDSKCRTYRGVKEKAKGHRSLTAVLGPRNNIVVPV